MAFSCQTRSFCPSCAAKRAALFGAYLVKERCASPCVVSHSCGPLQLKRALPATTQGSGPLPRGSPMPDSSLLAPGITSFDVIETGVEMHYTILCSSYPLSLLNAMMEMLCHNSVAPTYGST